MFSKHRRRLSIFLSLSLAAACATFSASSAKAAIVRDDASQLLPGVPVTTWQDTTQRPKAMAIAVHGLTMHGSVYDTMARRLASEGFIVIAPDLRGFGRWMETSANKDYNKMDYDQSYNDLVSLLKSAREEHPTLPMFCIGESLGAVMVLHAAAENPNEVSGLILSSPAIRRHAFVGPLTANAAPFIARPNRQVNLVPYIKRFASEDRQITEAALEDPLVRKHMSAFEFLRTCNTIKPALDYAEKLPSNMPVLIIQGSKDRMVRSNAVVLCLEHMKSMDQTVRWFSNRGHLLLETAYVRPDTMETVDAWLTSHAQKETVESIQARANNIDLNFAY